MSVYVSAAVWEGSSAKGNDLLVQLALADQANRDGWCWPGQGTLQRMTRLSRATVQRRISSLEKAGEIEVHPRPGTSNLYRVTPGGGIRYAQETIPTEGTPRDEAPQTEAPLVEAPGASEVRPLVASPGEAGDASPSEARSVTDPLVDPPETRGCETVGCDYPAGHKGAHRNPWWDALVEALGYRGGKVPPAQVSHFGRVVNEIRSLGDPPEMILQAARWIASEWGPSKVTLGSIQNHYARATSALAQITDRDVERFRERQAQEERQARLRALGPGTVQGDPMREESA